MAGIIESEKLQWNEFERSVNREPLQCFYQKATNDTYTASGYSFYVKTPGQGLLLDPDIWIKYTVNIVEAGANTLAGNFVTVAAAADTFVNGYAAADLRAAFRGGNIMQRATQQMNVIINGHSITSEPWKFIDVLNKLYVSDEESRHEFSSSGGRFDSGNHSHRCINDIPMAGVSAGNIAGAILGINAYNGVHTRTEVAATGAAGNNLLQMVQSAPLSSYFFNEGFNDRYLKFQDGIRRSQAPNAQLTVQYGANAATTTYTFVFYERLPIPPFKMYSSDGISGVIPNIKDLTIRGQFSSNLSSIVLRSSAAIAAVFSIAIPDGASNSSQCELLLKWYTPPMALQIPRELSIPLRKINSWATNKTINALGAGDNGTDIGVAISEYNISLDAVPDLLLIYLRARIDVALTNTQPDYYMFEINNLQINIEGASGKLNQIQTIDLYNKYKRYLHYKDSKLPPFDEWRRYTCFACLKPEDYGVIAGPGYVNQITLGVTFNANNWWNIPKMGLIPAENYASTTAELVIISIYDKWSLTIRDSGSAQSELSRIIPGVIPASSSLGLSELKPLGAGLRSIM